MKSSIKFFAIGLLALAGVESAVATTVNSLPIVVPPQQFKLVKPSGSFFNLFTGDYFTATDYGCANNNTCYKVEATDPSQSGFLALDSQDTEQPGSCGDAIVNIPLEVINDTITYTGNAQFTIGTCSAVVTGDPTSVQGYTITVNVPNAPAAK